MSMKKKRKKTENTYTHKNLTRVEVEDRITRQMQLEAAEWI